MYISHKEVKIRKTSDSRIRQESGITNPQATESTESRPNRKTA
jgi:hypothetical protein